MCSFNPSTYMYTQKSLHIIYILCIHFICEQKGSHLQPFLHFSWLFFYSHVRLWPTVLKLCPCKNKACCSALFCKIKWWKNRWHLFILAQLFRVCVTLLVLGHQHEHSSLHELSVASYINYVGLSPAATQPLHKHCQVSSLWRVNCDQCGSFTAGNCV